MKGKLIMDVRNFSVIHYIGWCLSIGLGYFVAGKLMLSISSTHVALIWPSAGIALCALLFRGWRLWPGILLGSLFSNMANEVTFFCSLSIAIGACLSALAGWYLLIRRHRFSMKLDNIQSIACFTLYGSIIPTIISAVVGNVSLLSFDLIDGDDFFVSFLSWWFGDAMGVLVLGSLIIMVIFPDTEHKSKKW